MHTVRSRLVSAALAGVTALVPACGGSSGEGIDVTMEEFAFTMPSSSIAAGAVTFSATNEGTSVHEIEVFAVPDGVDATAIPISENVADVEGAGLEIVDEIEDVAPATTAELTVDLDPGTYALICNLPGHYEAGMVATFDVG